MIICLLSWCVCLCVCYLRFINQALPFRDLMSPYQLQDLCRSTSAYKLATRPKSGMQTKVPIYLAVPTLASAISHSINRLMPRLTFCFQLVVWQTQQGAHSFKRQCQQLVMKTFLMKVFLLQDFKCADCGYSCKLKNDLINHITASHSREVIFISSN